MYTYNSLIFGVDFNEIDSDLIDKIVEFDFGNFFYENRDCHFLFYCPYHGGLTDNSNFACGIEVTNCDGNKGFLKEFKQAEKDKDKWVEEYWKQYEIFKKKIYENLEEYKEYFTDEESSENIKIAELITLVIEGTEPDFYLIEQSS